jgi:hypothetical protein
MEQILYFAHAHGFTAAQTGPNEVIIEIPAYNPATRETVIHCQPVRSMEEAREALGY